MINSSSAGTLAGHHAFLRMLQEAQEKDQKSQEKVLQKEAEQMRSLRIPQDERYKKMQHFRENAANGHFANLVGAAGGAADGCDVEVVVNREVFDPVEPAEREPRRKAPGVESRIEWQEAFDKKIRSLMEDFQLTDEPSTRLKHLDRMHAWFQDHGGKQTRKVVKGPEYLTVERDGDLPAGSTKNLPGLSQTSLQLAGAYALKSPRRAAPFSVR